MAVNVFLNHLDLHHAFPTMQSTHVVVGAVNDSLRLIAYSLFAWELWSIRE